MDRSRSRLRPHLVGGAGGDPALHVELAGARRALLVDCGELAPLPVASLLRVRDVFLSHAHIDHFCGFDRLLRVNLNHVRTIRVFGPPGILDRVAGKLAGYHWNLGTDLGIEFRVTEVDRSGFRTRGFHIRDRFRARGDDLVEPVRSRLIDESELSVEWATLDHGIPCLAFAIQEPDFHNVRGESLAEHGWFPGPWLGEFKARVVRGDPLGDSFETPTGPRSLGEVAEAILERTPGSRICYATDTGFTPATREALVALARGSDLFFCEHYYLHDDAGLAERNRHLTARQAGTIAREARVGRLVPFHHSPKYQGRYDELEAEGQEAFRGEGPSVLENLDRT